MFWRKDEDADTSVATRTAPAYERRSVVDVVGARGGVSGTAILTGVVVAFGTLFLLTALVAGVIVATGYTAPPVGSQEAIDAGLYGGIALVIAQLLAYLWGGYTAGRMARGAGAANGFLVPLFAILLGVAVAAIATALGANASLNLPFETARLPLEQSTAVSWGLGIGIASLVAMFVGGALGGAIGANWHTRLEEAAVAEGDVTYRNIDLTDRDETPTPPVATTTTTGRTTSTT